MAMFNSYVSLPEGIIYDTIWNYMMEFSSSWIYKVGGMNIHKSQNTMFFLGFWPIDFDVSENGV